MYLYRFIINCGKTREEMFTGQMTLSELHYALVILIKQEMYSDEIVNLTLTQFTKRLLLSLDRPAYSWMKITCSVVVIEYIMLSLRKQRTFLFCSHPNTILHHLLSRVEPMPPWQPCVRDSGSPVVDSMFSQYYIIVWFVAGKVGSHMPFWIQHHYQRSTHLS